MYWHLLLVHVNKAVSGGKPTPLNIKVTRSYGCWHSMESVYVQVQLQEAQAFALSSTVCAGKSTSCTRGQQINSPPTTRAWWTTFRSSSRRSLSKEWVTKLSWYDVCDSSKFCLSVVVGKHTTNTLLFLCASFARKMYSRIRTHMRIWPQHTLCVTLAVFRVRVMLLIIIVLAPYEHVVGVLCLYLQLLQSMV